jgi:hypothetical protein
MSSSNRVAYQILGAACRIQRACEFLEDRAICACASLAVGSTIGLGIELGIILKNGLITHYSSEGLEGRHGNGNSWKLGRP